MPIIGRLPPSDIVIPAPQISAEHAEITVAGPGRFQIRDLDSTNGTFVNGQRVREAEITPADCVRFGSHVFDWQRYRERLEAGASRSKGRPLGTAVMTSSRFSDYERLNSLGTGGMGTVHLARDKRFDRLVAIKVLRSDLLRRPEVVDRFKSEASIQARLLHPNIVKVYEFLHDEGRFAMVMEYVRGLSLEKLIDKEGPLSVDRTLSLMRDMLAGVGHAHLHGLVHRDLKPSNVLTTELDGALRAKVTDFGIARILSLEKRRTATDARMGTLLYMSPEHVQSPKGAGIQSDIYALGVSLYEMLCGLAPFDSDSAYELMRQIVEDPPVPASERTSARVPEWLDRVVLRAVAKDPADRFQSCAEFAAAIESRWENPGNGGGPIAAARTGESTVNQAILDEALAAAVWDRESGDALRLLAQGADPNARSGEDRLLLLALDRPLQLSGFACYRILRRAGARHSLKTRFLYWARVLDWATLIPLGLAAVVWVGDRLHIRSSAEAAWGWLLLALSLFVLGRALAFLSRVTTDR